MIGVTIDLLGAAGWSTRSAFQGAFALVALSCVASYLWFLWFDDVGKRTADLEAGA